MLQVLEGICKGMRTDILLTIANVITLSLRHGAPPTVSLSCTQAAKPKSAGAQQSCTQAAKPKSAGAQNARLCAGRAGTPAADSGA